jgi:hypothetical protein
MAIFEERQRAAEQKFSRDEDLAFRARNRRNRLFGMWIAEDQLGLTGEAATAYAKDVVMADFDLPGDEDMLGKVRADLGKAGKSISDHLLQKRLGEFLAIAREQVMKE